MTSHSFNEKNFDGMLPATKKGNGKAEDWKEVTLAHKWQDDQNFKKAWELIKNMNLDACSKNGPDGKYCIDPKHKFNATGEEKVKHTINLLLGYYQETATQKTSPERLAFGEERKVVQKLTAPENGKIVQPPKPVIIVGHSNNFLAWFQILLKQTKEQTRCEGKYADICKRMAHFAENKIPNADVMSFEIRGIHSGNVRVEKFSTHEENEVDFYNIATDKNESKTAQTHQATKTEL